MFNDERGAADQTRPKTTIKETNEREGHFGSTAAISRSPRQDFHRPPSPLRPTLPALRQSISNTRILVSSSPCSLYLSAAKDDKTGLSDLRGARCAILQPKSRRYLGNQLPFYANLEQCLAYQVRGPVIACDIWPPTDNLV